MKKFISLLLIIGCVAALASCGKSESKKADDTIDTEDYKIEGRSIAEGLEYDYDDLSEYITICDYHNIEIECDINTVTDNDVDNAIQEALDNAGTSTDVADRTAQEGDTVTFTGKGVVQDDGSSFDIEDESTLTIGRGADQGFAQGFDEKFVGAKANESFEFEFTYPEDYTHEIFRGKTVTFTLNIVSVKVIDSEELTDDFVKGLEIDGVSTVDEYRAYIEKRLNEYNDEKNLQNKETAVHDYLVLNCSIVKYPEKELQRYLDNTDSTVKSYATAYGQTEEEYKIAQYGSVEEYENQKLLEAQNSVKEDLIIYCIARENNITVGDDEYEEAIKYGFENYASDYGLSSMEDFEAMYSSSITSGLLTVNVLEMIAKEATVK